MNDSSRRLPGDSAGPESVRSLLDTTSARMLACPAPEDKARAIADLCATLTARLARPRARWEDEAPASTAPTAPPPPAGPALATHAPQPALTFEAWTDLSIRFLGASHQEKLATLTALGLTIEAWTSIDDNYVCAMSTDLLAGRMERPAFYAARCHKRAPVPLPAVLRPPVALKVTAEAVNLPRAIRESMGKMPFKDPPPGPPVPVKRCEKTKPVPVMRSALDQTAPLDEDTIRKVVATLPFTGSAAPVGITCFPDLTVHEYVSLRAALAVMGATRGETLRSYGVPSEASWRALEEHWRQHLAASAELRAEMDAVAEALKRWVRGW